MEQTNKATSVGWLLDDFAARVPEVDHVLVLSVDGLLIAASSGLDRADAEHLSAVASGLQSLARSVGERFQGGAVRQTIVEMKSAYLWSPPARGRVGVGTASADIGLIAYEMTMLVKRSDRRSTPLRTSAQ